MMRSSVKVRTQRALAAVPAVMLAQSVKLGGTVAARESAAMVEARRLITEEGLSAYAAANKVGLTRSAIYMAPWYKAWKGSK